MARRMKFVLKLPGLWRAPFSLPNAVQAQSYMNRMLACPRTRLLHPFPPPPPTGPSHCQSTRPASTISGNCWLLPRDISRSPLQMHLWALLCPCCVCAVPWSRCSLQLYLCAVLCICCVCAVSVLSPGPGVIVPTAIICELWADVRGGQGADGLFPPNGAKVHEQANSFCLRRLSRGFY